AQLHKTIEMDPRFYFAHWALGTALQLKGQLSDAVAEYSKAVELNDDPSVLALLGQAYARAGQRDEAQKILVRLSEEAKSRYVQGYSFALMYLALGDKSVRLTRWNERIASATPTSLRLKSIQCLMISAATSASKRWLTGFFLSMSDKSWQQTRSELEPFLKGQPDNYLVIGDLALTIMALGDK